MTSEEEKNKALARRFVEAQAKGDLDAVDQMLAPDFVNHNILVPGQEPDREGYMRGISAYKAALSPGRLIIEDQVAGGDKVVTRILAYATHDRGELMGVAPSGRELTNRGIEIHRIVEGKIAEEWGMGTLATKLRGQRLEQERIERERIEQELRVARSIQHASLPKEVPTTGGLADLPLLPASQGGRRRLLRLPPPFRGPSWGGRGGCNGQGCACGPGDVYHLRHVAGSLTSLGLLAWGGTRSGQRDVVGSHPLQHVRNLLLRHPGTQER